MMFWILSTHPVDIVFISLGEVLSRSFAVVKGLLTAVTSPRLQVNMVNDITRCLDYTIHLPVYVTFPPLNKQEAVELPLTGHDHHCATRAGLLGTWGYHLNSLPQACDQRYGNDSHQKLLTPSIIITSTLDINSFLLCSWISFKHFGLVIIASKSAGIQCEASWGFKEFSYFLLCNLMFLSVSTDEQNSLFSSVAAANMQGQELCWCDVAIKCHHQGWMCAVPDHWRFFPPLNNTAQPNGVDKKSFDTFIGIVVENKDWCRNLYSKECVVLSFVFV